MPKQTKLVALVAAITTFESKVGEAAQELIQQGDQSRAGNLLSAMQLLKRILSRPSQRLARSSPRNPESSSASR